MVEGAPSSESTNQPIEREELPDRLRVHSLARTLGTTSQRVLDALTSLDGRIRSAHSTVDHVDAVRVRDLLAAQAPDAPATTGVPGATDAPPAPDLPTPGEPESRLMLQTPETPPGPQTDVERPHYMPLFVAPQPIELDDDAGDDYADDTDDADGYGPEDDDEQTGRPASRRRRRGRRGRGRGRGEQNGSDGPADGRAGDDANGPADREAEQWAQPGAPNVEATGSEDIAGPAAEDADDTETGEADNGSPEGRHPSPAPPTAAQVGCG